MPVTISLAGRERTGIQVPALAGLGSGRARRTAVEKRMFRAVTGGVAISDPGAAVKKQDEKKGDLIAAAVKDAELKKLFDAVDNVVDDPDSAPDPTDLDRAVARMLGTRATYVAAVRAVAQKDKAALTAGLNWAASLDVDRLAKAGDRANTELKLDLIPPVEKKQVALEKRVESLESELDALKADMAALAKRPPASGK